MEEEDREAGGGKPRRERCEAGEMMVQTETKRPAGFSSAFIEAASTPGRLTVDSLQ